MSKKIQDILCICICIYLGLLIFAKVSVRIEPEHLVGHSVIQFVKQSERESVQNVFDEMVEEKYTVMEGAEHITAGDELNIRLAYYDYEADNPGWLGNGKGEIWQGWITLKIDDIREFLSGDGFYIEEKEIKGGF